MIIEKIFNGRNNSIDLLLKADGVAVDLGYVTKMQLVIGSTTVSSDTDPTCFDWTHSPAVTGKLILNLGGKGLTAGEYQKATLYVFSADNPNGIKWDDLILNIYA